MTPFQFWKNFTDPKTGVFQAANGEELVILACTVFDLSTRVTDRQTDRIAMAKMRYSSTCKNCYGRLLCCKLQWCILNVNKIDGIMCFFNLQALLNKY